MDEALPRTLGDFELLERLGEGGMGTVYRARQRSMDRVVALKVLARELGEEREHVERFLREARAAAKVNHPNVITIYDAGEADGRLLLALELVQGGDAEQLARAAGGRLPEARALELVRDCAHGLGALEAAGLVHRDIKPSNIFVTKDGVAKLADLGLARAGEGTDRVTRTNMIVGTPSYMAPEQAEGRADLDVRADVYALGATLFQLLTGRPPHVGPLAVVLTSKLGERVPDPRELDPAISPGTARLVMRCLARRRDDRYATARALLEAVEEARAPRRPRPVEPARVIAPTPAPAPERDVGSFVAAAIGAALFVAGVVVATRSPPAPPPRPPAATTAAPPPTEEPPPWPIPEAAPVASPAAAAIAAVGSVDPRPPLQVNFIEELVADGAFLPVPAKDRLLGNAVRAPFSPPAGVAWATATLRAARRPWSLGPRVGLYLDVQEVRAVADCSAAPTQGIGAGAIFFELGLQAGSAACATSEELSAAAVWVTLVFGATGHLWATVRAVDEDRPGRGPGSLDPGRPGLHRLGERDAWPTLGRHGRASLLLSLVPKSRSLAYRADLFVIGEDGARPTQSFAGDLPEPVARALLRDGVTVWVRGGNFADGSGSATVTIAQ